MTAPTNPAASDNSFLNQSKTAWSKFSPAQKWGLAVIVFIVFVLPLSLLVIKTQTNWFPKADEYPVTSPIEEPVTPPMSPTPSCLPQPSPSCYPSGTAGGGTVCSMPAPPSGYSYCPYPTNYPSPNPGTPFPSPSIPPYVSPPPKSSPKPPGAGCMRAGCSGELCVAEGSGPQLMTICVYKPEYACYNNAACEKQSNGQCGFTMTDEVKACLASNMPKDIINAYAFFTEDTTQPPPLPTNETKYLGRRTVYITTKFPTRVEANNDYTEFSYFSNQYGATVTVKPVLTRASGGFTGAPENVPFEVGYGSLNGVGDGTQMAIRPKVYTSVNGFFDKGYMYNLTWQFTGSRNDVAYNTQFATISTSKIVSDLNNDNKVDIQDFSILSREFLKTKLQYDADINGDQQVNLLDYALFVKDYKSYTNSTN